MAVGTRLRWSYLAAFFLLVAAIIIAFGVRMVLHPEEPSIQIVSVDGISRSVLLSQMKQMPVLTREGTYQNQFSNWRDKGTYTGVRLTDLIGSETKYHSILVGASDGYEVKIDRERVEDPNYPMILAYALDGVEVPAWEMGFRIAVLPEDGNVSNEEYDTPSAGSFWVKNVTKITLNSGS